jgi:hypothetical protein
MFILKVVATIDREFGTVTATILSQQDLDDAPGFELPLERGIRLFGE